ncbi:Ig-like domain-containing protein [Salimicrobium halophilum]|uniref:SbsA Ig-like domain-containing protein n=1 Tax=Salimicrobium halophilum TaxID=86666 RepID=A0A1G8SCR8_9BACI|nr:Ig-like domain-containing protein [Salimicrobium halophilum]SDJ27056.1 hypothetical protein SAMN04490247_1387 [Salimicrobium halophilum]
MKKIVMNLLMLVIVTFGMTSTVNADDYVDIGHEDGVPVDKTWTVAFKTPMYENDYEEYIFLERVKETVSIEDEEGATYAFTAETEQKGERTLLHIKGKELYKYEETYTLYVEAALKDYNDVNLKNPVKKTFTTVDDLSMLGAFSPDQELPEETLNTEISSVHSGMDYWNWLKEDESYIENKSVTNQVLFKEMYALQEEYEQVMDEVLNIKGMQYYPSAVYAKRDILSRAIEARYNTLYEGESEYPDEYLRSMGERISYWPNDENEGKLPADKLIYNTLLDLPYEYDFLDGMEVISNIHTSGEAGFALSFPSLISISASDERAPETFYHELGHIFDYTYDPQQETYEMIRGYDDYDEYYGNSFVESFAEDFKVTMFPYSDVVTSSKVSGSPTESQQEALRNYYDELKQNSFTMDPVVTFDGMEPYSRIWITDDETLDIEVENYDYSFMIETPGGQDDQVMPGDTYRFTEEGAYIANTVTGAYTIIYDSDRTWGE